MAPATDKPEPDAELVDASSKPIDFETAIEACGFGAFNVYLLLVVFLGITATLFEASTMAYVLPSAECDLQLTLMDKGVVNAVTYAGMIVSAVPWGYMADTKGRKKVLVWGLLLNSAMTLLCALSWSYAQILIFKFFGGAIVCGPFAVLMSYLSELHSKKHRSRVIMISGMMKSAGSLVLPALAIGILPQDWTLKLFSVQFYIWQLFIAITAVPGLISGLLIALYFPESPQFLMSQGRHAEALHTFQYIYAVNHRKPRDSYPISNLRGDATAVSPSQKSVAQQKVAEPKVSIRESLKRGSRQLEPLFRRPYLTLSLLVYAVNLCLLMGQNTIRFWLPQLFATMAEYEDRGLGDVGICEILEYNVNRTELVKAAAAASSAPAECVVHITSGSYTNNIIVSLAGVAGAFAVSFVVNKLGNRNILNIGTVLAFMCGTSLYWSSSSTMTLVLAATFLTLSNVNSTTVISTSVSLFPTSMRTMVVVMTNTFGRFGSLTGNVLFPLFITYGCVPPFLFLGGVTLCTALLTFLLPASTKTL